MGLRVRRIDDLPQAVRSRLPAKFVADRPDTTRYTGPLTIRIRLPWPPSANHMFPTVVRGKHAVRVLSADGKEYRRQVGLHVLAQHIPVRQLHGKLGVLIECYPKDRRAHDLGNLEKAILDSLTAHQVIEDDCYVDDLHLIRCEASPTPHVFVTISELLRAEQIELQGAA